MAERLGAFARPTGDGLSPAGAPASWLVARPRPVLLAAVCGVAALAAGALAPVHLQYAVAVVGAAALVMAVLLRPLAGAYLLVGLVPITSGLASGFPVPKVRLSEAVIGLVGVTILASVRRRDAVPWQVLDWALLAYGLAWTAFGVMADRLLGQGLTITEWGTVLGQLQFFLVYRGVRVAVRTSAERRRALGVLLVCSAVPSLLAILQEIHAPGVRAFVTRITGGIATGSVGGATRATGPFDNWAALAGYLLPIVLVLLACAFAGIETRHRRWFVAVGAVAAVGLAVTDEQSAILCLLVGLVVLARHFARGRRLMRWVMGGIAVVALAASPLLIKRLVTELAASAGTGRIWWMPQTVSFRWTVWIHQYVPAILARPLTGYGVVLPTSVHWPFPESQYVSFMMEGGLPMLAIFGLLAWAMVGGAVRAARSGDPLVSALGWAVAIAVVSMLVMDSMWPFLSNGGMPQVLWVLLALTVPGAVRDGGPLLAPPATVRRAPPVGRPPTVRRAPTLLGVGS